jgi:hypothetical protein
MLRHGPLKYLVPVTRQTMESSRNNSKMFFMYRRPTQVSGGTKPDYLEKAVVTERQHHSRQCKRSNKQIYKFKDIHKLMN